MVTLREEVQSGPRARLLVVDDESSLAELVAMALRYEGFEVATAGCAAEALRMLPEFRPDLLVLDVMLPDVDGFALASQLRRDQNRAPILFLTARDAVEDRVHGLTIGGDDYLTKPFAVAELVARVRVILRRHGVGERNLSRLVFADLEMDDDSHEVFRAGARVELTATEYRLLHYLLSNAKRVLTRAQLLDHVWNYDFGGDASVLETYISYLRRKIDTSPPRLLHTVRGVGYVLRLPRD